MECPLRDGEARITCAAASSSDIPTLAHCALGTAFATDQRKAAKESVTMYYDDASNPESLSYYTHMW